MIKLRLLDERDARAITASLADADWSTGKARTAELTGTVKQNEEILQHKTLNAIALRLQSNHTVQLHAVPQQFFPPKFSRYVTGARYHRHTDSPWMGQVRTDLSCTIWLNDDYEGGELVVDGQKLKGKPGECVIYNCGSPHEVLPVTKGERICAITWIESRIRCPVKRKLVTSFRQTLSKVENDQSLLVEFGQIHSALIRMWME